VGASRPRKPRMYASTFDEVQQLRAARGVPLIDPADPRTKERYGL
jgi:hypothetical protein